MTDLKKPVTRTVGDLVVEISALGVRYREKGRRTWFGPIRHGALYLQLVQAEVAAARREKQQTRKVRKVSRGLLSVG